MKVIFLDIDGVLNTSKTYMDISKEYRETGKERLEIDLKRGAFLKEIVERTNAVIVLSSSWRLLGSMQNGVFTSKNKRVLELIKIFQEYNLQIYDITPYLNGNRELEIKTWLKDKDIESFIIIDDDAYDLQSFINKELIKTYFTNKNIDDCGLTKEDISIAIKKLTKKR